MKIKLIATDLDDTLMRPDRGISEFTVSVFDRCRKLGMLTCFLTARSAKASAQSARLISPDYMVTCGGALCLFGDETLFEVILARDEANEIISFCKTLPSMQSIQAETAERNYYIDNAELTGMTGDYAHVKYYDFNFPLSCGVYKLMARIDDERDRRALIKQFPNARIYNYVGGTTCFIASKAATKLRGLEIVAMHAGISLGEIAAFGDDTGDVDYLAACGYGVAVENAVAAAKSAAKYMCGPNSDDGVARWLEENCLKRSPN